MKLIILPGNSPKNKEWALQVAQMFRGKYSPIHIQSYDHWHNGREVIDLNLELKKLSQNLSQEEGYIIIAKSIGIVLAMKGFAERKLDPLKCVFFGFPLEWCEKNKIPAEEWLRKFGKAPSLFIQQTDDPYLPAKELRFVLHDDKLQNCLMYEIPGKDHNYWNIGETKNLIDTFLD